jgi:hypothetical protein
MTGIEDMPGIAEASAKLDAMIASEGGDTANATTEQSVDQGQHAGQTEPAEAQSQSLPTDTPATTEKQNDGKPIDEAEAPAETPEQPGKTRFEKAQERLPKSWKEFNAQKEETAKTHAQREAQLAKRETELQQREANFDSQRREPTAQDYEAHAGRLLAASRAFEAEAKALEDKGDFPAAEAKRRLAQRQELYAEDALKAAEDVRKNPPDAKALARQHKIDAERREWTIKAGIDFPELAKKDSPLLQATALILQSESELQGQPKGTYIAARIAAAELAAARVPDLEKRLASKEARVKDLEALTTPGGAGSPARVPPGDAPRSDAEQFAELQRMAESMGPLGI